jgi:hypothetical protein
MTSRGLTRILSRDEHDRDEEKIEPGEMNEPPALMTTANGMKAERWSNHAYSNGFQYASDY